MKKYEYLLAKNFFPREANFNDLGQSGWIFAGTVPPEDDSSKAYRWYVFYREAPQGESL